MPNPATNLRDLYSACDPEEALPGGRTHDYYHDLSAGRHIRRVTDYIRNTLSLEAAAPGAPPRHSKVLLTGHIGTGKSTELNSLADDLVEDGYFVVRIAALRELNIYDLGWQDLLLELAFQVYDQGTKAAEAGHLRCRPSGDLLKQIESWLDHTSLTEALRTSAELSTTGEAGLKSPLPWVRLGVGFKSLWKSGSTRTKEVRRELEPRTEQLIADLNAFLTDFNNRLVKEGKKGLVVIIDDLEKIPLQLGEAGANPPVDLFVHHAGNLKAPACHIIYTVPILLFYDYNLGDVYPQLEPCVLPMVRVRTRVRKRDPAGVDCMRQLLLKRAHLDQVAEPTAVTELIIKSGATYGT